MIIPSIDIADGQAVQLIEGEQRALEAGDPLDVMSTFRLAGEVAVVDLDAARGRSANREIIESLIDHGQVRVGGGIRSVATARDWLEAGADRIVLGTAAEPDVLKELPSDRVIAALDAKHDEVVVEGWTTPTGESIRERMDRLRPYVSEFLITFVEREGHQQGTDLERARELANAAGDTRVTIAGGISTPEEIATLDAWGIDAQVGMALYDDTLHLADGITAPLESDRNDGLLPTVVADERGRALGLAYSNRESVRTAVEEQRGVYHSRERGLWRKGETSGATQDLLEITPDCDRDTLRFRVTQRPPGFCHRGTDTCWGDRFDLGRLQATIRARDEDRPADSYTAELLANEHRLDDKLREEIDELIEATAQPHQRHEAADVLYFLLVKLQAADLSIHEIEDELRRRARQTTEIGDPTDPREEDAND